ncbi:MAG: hypothetical protein ACO2OY_09105 [Thermodesulfobacteriaceae bacterium]|jgi:hypothetical protein
MKKLIALLVGLTFAFGSVGFAVAAGEKKGGCPKKDNATENATKKEEKPKKKKVEGC